MADSADEIVFRDGLGDRVLVRNTKGRPLHETLVLRSDLAGVPAFEFALNERLTQLDKFDNSAFLCVRQLVRLPGAVPRLSLVSDHVAGGVRLSEVLGRSQATEPLSTGTALFLIKEILDAVAVLHRQNPDVSHGALAPERILIVDGKVRIADYVLGSAIEQLRYTPERYWKDLRVAVPSSAGGVRFDRRVDVAQVGMIAVALLASRPLGDAENIGGLDEVLMCLTQSTDVGPRTLSVPMRGWLMKALQMDLRRTFVTALEAVGALHEAMAEAGLRPASNELEIASMRPRRATTTLAVKTVATKIPTSEVITQAPLARPAPPVVDQREQRAQRTQRRVAKTMAPVGDEPTARTTARFPKVVFDSRLKRVFTFGVVAALMAVAFTAAQYIPPPAKWFSTTGTLAVESKPAGVQLLVDGKVRGVTPLTLKLSTGLHKVELRHGTPRVFNVFVTKGDVASQYIEFPAVRPRRQMAP